MAQETAHPGLGAKSWAQTSVGQYVDEAETRDSVITIDASAPVDDACQTLIFNHISSAPVYDPAEEKYIGMFDYQDVVAYILLLFRKVDHADLNIDNEDHVAPDDSQVAPPPNDRFLQILQSAKKIIESNSGTAGSVPVKLASDLSQRNPFCAVTSEMPLRGIVDVLADGIKRVVVMDDKKCKAIVSQSALIKYLYKKRNEDKRLQSLLRSPLCDLGVRRNDVVTCPTSATVLEALGLMNDQRVSSLAVVDTTGTMIGNLSLSDVKYILHRGHHSLLWKPCRKLIAFSRHTQGLIDGKDSAPVFGVKLTSPLELVMGKLVATRSHRVWVTSAQGKPDGILTMTDVFGIIKSELDSTLEEVGQG